MNERANVPSPATGTAGAGDAGLVRLAERPDLQVADDAHDVRGWRVSAGEHEVGTVRDLLIDPTVGRVRFLEVALDGRGDGSAARVRVEDARLDLARRRIAIDPAAAGAAAAPAAAVRRDVAPDVARDIGRDVSRDAGRGVPDDVPARLTLSEEQLHVGKRTVQAGEADVRKVVETRPVRSAVQLGREELVIERHPVAEDSSTEVRVDGDVIRIPVLEERLVVEKRLVPVEEVVIRRRVVTHEETVETELRRERVVIDGQPLPDAPTR